jgi:hypothetical protein
LKDLAIDGIIILEVILIVGENVNWIDLVQDRNKWQNLLKKLI